MESGMAREKIDAALLASGLQTHRTPYLRQTKSCQSRELLPLVFGTETVSGVSVSGEAICLHKREVRWRHEVLK